MEAHPTSVTLVPISPALAATLSERGIIESEHAVQTGGQLDLIRDIVGQNLAFLASAPRPDPWGTYLAVDAESRLVVGACGFKSSPTPDRTVEIAYYTFPPYEGRGFGTAMARTLFDIGNASGELKRVIAHTLPEPNASNSLLRKVGFKDVGEVLDPEDGRVWRFERTCNSRRD